MIYCYYIFIIVVLLYILTPADFIDFARPQCTGQGAGELFMRESIVGQMQGAYAVVLSDILDMINVAMQCSYCYSI